MNDFVPVKILSADSQGSTSWWLKRVKGLPFQWEQVHDKPEALDNVKKIRAKHVMIDTPGSLDDESLLKKALEHADDVTLPLPPEPLAFDAIKRTIDRVIIPRDLTFRVVVNDWDPRDGTSERDGAIEYIRGNKWPRTKSTVRKYKLHTRAPLEGKVVTQYPRNRVALEAREDFFRLAMELGWGDHDDPEPRVHVFAGQKGGVGKTTLAVGLAAVIHETLTGGA